LDWIRKNPFTDDTMTSPIFMLKKSGEIIPMIEEQYETEYDLQKLLAEHPELILSDYIGLKNSRLLLVKKEATVPGDELGTNTFYLDHLFLDQEGVPTLVEVKRSTDTRIRREVVGQMLDYAANALLYWPVEKIQGMFNSTWEAQNRKPDEILKEFLGIEGDRDKFWNEVKKNLLSGNIRIIFVADSIPDSLKNIVQFLNNQMNPAEVLAVDIRQFVSGDLQVIVPKVIGQSTQAVQRKNPGQKTKWDEQSFFAELAGRGTPENVTAARKILQWANDRGLRIWWGEGVGLGTFFPMVDHKDGGHQVIAVWTTPKIELQFQWMKGYPAFAPVEKRMQFLQMIKAIKGVTIPDDKIGGRPSFDLSLLNDENSFNQLIKALDWFVAEIKAT